MFGRESRKERFLFKIGMGVLLLSLWIVTLFVRFNIYWLILLIIFTPIYLITLVMSLGRGAGSDTDSKTSPDRYGKSY
ncbi:MAG: hypothetical protein KGY66_08475 [Candidatus Thermoplasmatota archaeon]|nr:hypothetical protein [Candidatus Thermoplasmatota archaeon]MBS3790931.1 hypothetical protein [Candidatus Thermoplasmatota archaeon]